MGRLRDAVRRVRDIENDLHAREEALKDNVREGASLLLEADPEDPAIEHNRAQRLGSKLALNDMSAMLIEAHRRLRRLAEEEIAELQAVGQEARAREEEHVACVNDRVVDAIIPKLSMILDGRCPSDIGLSCGLDDGKLQEERTSERLAGLVVQAVRDLLKSRIPEIAAVLRRDLAERPWTERRARLEALRLERRDAEALSANVSPEMLIYRAQSEQ